MSETLDSIVADETQKVQAEMQDRINGRLADALVKAKEVLFSVQADVDELTTEIADRIPTPETPVEPSESQDQPQG